jgi:hypothetical protein
MTSFLALFLTVFVLGTVDGLAQKRKPALKRKPVARKVVPVNPLYAVPTGTVIRARMNKTLSSKTARVGEVFSATVTEPVYSANGVVVIPVGSSVQGRIDQALPAAKGGKPGQIDVRFTRVRLPNGSSRAINGSLTEANIGSEVDNEGTASGKTMKNRKVIFIGGGGAGGAIIGAAVGGGKGALIGGLLGAGGGYLGERLTKGSEAEVKSGTEFGVYLNQAISLPRFAEATVRRP